MDSQAIRPDTGSIPGTDLAIYTVLVYAENQTDGCRNNPAYGMLSLGKAVISRFRFYPILGIV
jgi:hypothetical protein